MGIDRARVKASAEAAGRAKADAKAEKVRKAAERGEREAKKAAKEPRHVELERMCREARTVGELVAVEPLLRRHERYRANQGYRWSEAKRDRLAEEAFRVWKHPDSGTVAIEDYFDVRKIMPAEEYAAISRMRAVLVHARTLDRDAPVDPGWWDCLVYLEDEGAWRFGPSLSTPVFHAEDL